MQSLHHDGSIMLHTRSLKYGKLGRGQLVVVPASLIKRQKQHFQTLPLAGGWVGGRRRAVGSDRVAVRLYKHPSARYAHLAETACALWTVVLAWVALGDML